MSQFYQFNSCSGANKKSSAGYFSGVSTWWTKIFQSLELQTDAFALSFYHTLAQIPGMIIASSLIDLVGRRRLVIIGFVGASTSLLLLSTTAKAIHSSANEVMGEGYSFIVLGLACIYSVCLCICWLSLECLSTESFPTKVRSTGRGVCVATGRLAGFSIQFVYGNFVNDNKISYMLGFAAVISTLGVLVSYQTTDTTNVDLQDHWDYGKGTNETTKVDDDPQIERPAKRISFADETHSKYLSIE